MKFDIFFSICQTDVNGLIPSDRQMFQNFFDQVKLADKLGYGTAWVAETHLSCQTQKLNPQSVIPHFKGEIGLNSDILQLAQRVFSMTSKINVGSAIRNILCNGGPLAHAEAIRMFLSLHSLDQSEKRRLNIGFAAGRFPFSNIPYGIVPRNRTEKAAWSTLKGLIFQEATEVFLRALKGEVFESSDIQKKVLTADLFRSPEDWEEVLKIYRDESEISGTESVTEIEIPSYWVFDKVSLIPTEAPLDLLDLTIGSHDPVAQKLANTLMPCGVFNLSITPSTKIDDTHNRMEVDYHKDGGPWKRDNMPRTALVFVNGDKSKTPEQQSILARVSAEKALKTYWQAMEGTIDNAKIEEAVNNSISGNPKEVAMLLKEKYHNEDRLMLWFDFNNHDNEEIKNNMQTFMEEVAPLLA